MIEDVIDSHLRELKGLLSLIKEQYKRIEQFETEIENCGDVLDELQDEIDLTYEHLEELGWDGE